MISLILAAGLPKRCTPFKSEISARKVSLTVLTKMIREVQMQGEQGCAVKKEKRSFSQ